MGNQSSLMLTEDEIANIEAKTKFTAKQIKKLYGRFTSLDRAKKGYLCREDLNRIPELAINPLGERIVDAFYSETGSSDDRLNFLHFTKVLANFRASATHQNQLKFAFKMFDTSNGGFVSTEQVAQLLGVTVGDNMSHEQVIAIAQRTIHDADKDLDGLVSFQEFSEALQRSDIEGKMSICFFN